MELSGIGGAVVGGDVLGVAVVGTGVCIVVVTLLGTPVVEELEEML